MEVLKQFPDESVDCVVTSPPYWNLRDYGEETIVKWGDGSVCQLGHEKDFNLFVQHLLEIFDEVKRVLKTTGTLWVNISDTYGGSGMGIGSGINRYFSKENYHPRGSETKSSRLRKTKYNKSLLLIPERFAIGMVERGWILRNKIIWKKTNGIPESVKDRFTKSYEYIYFFVKSEKYYFNQILEPAEISSIARYKRRDLKGNKYSSFLTGLNPVVGIESYRKKAGGRLLYRNKKDVWEFATAQFSAKKFGIEGVDHFAVFPEELPKICIDAGCPVYVCESCGMPREKILERVQKKGNEKDVTGKYMFGDNLTNSPSGRSFQYAEVRQYKLPKSMLVAFARYLREKVKGREKELDKLFGRTKWEHWIRTDYSGQSLPSPGDYKKLKSALGLSDEWDKWIASTVLTLVDDSGGSYKEVGWSEICLCGSTNWTSGIVLDIFAGAGTTLAVAEKLNRRWIGVELNKNYCEIIKRRIKPLNLPLLSLLE